MGDVREIFIPKQRNKEGRRYGFVRYKGVSNASYLERKLDNIVVGGLKLHVNIPKYRRGKDTQEQNTVSHGRHKVGGNQRSKVATTPNMKRSYVEAVTSHPVNTGGQRPTPSLPTVHGVSHSSVTLDISEEMKNGYVDTWVGRLKRQQVFDRVEDELAWVLGSEVSPKYLGDDMVLLIGLSDAKAQKLIQEEIDQGTSMFYALEKWNSKINPGTRLIWVQCWGIPLVAWSMDNTRKIVAAVGDLVEVDDDFEDMQRLDRARVLVRTPRRPTVEHVVTTTIDGDSYKIYIVEEHWHEGMACARHRRSVWGSSDEVYSDEGDFGTPQSRPSKASPRPTINNMHDDSIFRQGMAIPNGQSGNDDPLDNDRCGKTRVPSSALRHLREENRMETQQTTAGAGYEDGESQPAGVTANVTPKGKHILARSSVSVADSQEGEAIGLDQGHKVESTYIHSNGPLETISNKSRDFNVNLLGPNFTLDTSRPTTPENPQKDLQNQPASAIQVYWRKKGCVKKWAKDSGKFPCIMDSVDSRMVETDRKEPETQPQLGSALQVGIEDTMGMHEEAKIQWEMANQLGLSCGRDHTKFTDKIAEMETRDRMEAETLGNRNSHHEHSVL